MYELILLVCLKGSAIECNKENHYRAYHLGTYYTLNQCMNNDVHVGKILSDEISSIEEKTRTICEQYK